MSLEGAILGIGNPLLDISTHCSADLLEKYGETIRGYHLKGGNAIMAEPSHLPLYAELTSGKYKVDFIAGGATQNSIRACQYLLQEKGATTYMGCIGDDEYGRQLAAAAARDGVRTKYMVTKDAPTGTCACLIVERERSLVANLGAANHFKISHLMEPEQQAIIEKARIFYISGFFLTVSPDSALYVAKHASEHNKIFGLNLAAPFIMEVFGQHVDNMLPYSDYVFGNEHEWAVFGRVHGYPETDLAAVAQKAAGLPKANSRPRVCICTQGAEAVLVCTQDSVQRFPVNKVPKSEIVDTNGCGDSFVGGFLAGLARGWPLEKCVQAGNYVASEVIRRDGCSFPPHPPTFAA